MFRRIFYINFRVGALKGDKDVQIWLSCLKNLGLSVGRTKRAVERHS